MIVHWEEQGVDYYKFKAKDIDMLLPTMIDVQFEKIAKNTENADIKKGKYGNRTKY